MESTRPASPAIELTPSPPAHAKRHFGRLVAVTLLVCLVASAVALGTWAIGRPPEVDVVVVRVEDVSRMLAVTGRVEALQTVSVSPQFSGRVTEIVRREGERVKKGEVLARLADTSAKADVVQQEAALSSKEHDLAQAKRDFARTSALVATGAAPAEELESARLAVARATDDVRRLAAALGESRAQLALLAPFDGTIIRRDAEIGQVVGAGSIAFEVASVDSVRVSAEVDERYVRALRQGMSAEVLPVGASDARAAATVSYVGRAVDPQTGAATVRFAYEQAPTDVLVGMSVDVNVSVETIPSALIIPREAVGGSGEQTSALVVTNDRVVRRPVVVDDWPAPWVVVRGGLAQGELVLIDPKGAEVGTRVRVKVATDDL